MDVGQVIPDRTEKHEAHVLFLANGGQCPEQQQCGERHLCSAVRRRRWEAKALTGEAMSLPCGVKAEQLQECLHPCMCLGVANATRRLSLVALVPGVPAILT